MTNYAHPADGVLLWLEEGGVELGEDQAGELHLGAGGWVGRWTGEQVK